MKRLFDLTVAALALLVLAPLMLSIATLIAIDSPGGVFFRQERVGLNARPFKIVKFRTMVRNAHLQGPFYTSPSDSRITRIGKYLRKCSLDELPQLLNIISGHMSLVGPRPDVPEQKPVYSDDEWRLRHTVRPGITGLAQATLRSSASVDQRKRLDLNYVRNHSFALDLRILAMTAYQVFAKGSY